MDNKVLELYLKAIQDGIHRQDENITKLFEKQDLMNIILAENTLIVKEHEKRSTGLEGIQRDISDQMEGVGKTMVFIKTEIKRLDIDFTKEIKRVDEDIKPIKSHVNSMSKTVSWVKAIPKSIKVIGTLIIFIASILGVHSGWKIVAVELGKVIVK